MVGPSGSGKTTLLRLIAGFEAPDAGEIRLDGALLADPRAAVPPHRRNIGLVMQDGALFPHLSVLDNIRFGDGGAQIRTPGRWSCSTWSSSTARWPRDSRTSSPAGSSSGWRSLGRWCGARA